MVHRRRWQGGAGKGRCQISRLFHAAEFISQGGYVRFVIAKLWCTSRLSPEANRTVGCTAEWIDTWTCQLWLLHSHTYTHAIHLQAHTQTRTPQPCSPLCLLLKEHHIGWVIPTVMFRNLWGWRCVISGLCLLSIHVSYSKYPSLTRTTSDSMLVYNSSF